MHKLRNPPNKSRAFTSNNSNQKKRCAQKTYTHLRINFNDGVNAMRDGKQYYDDYKVGAVVCYRLYLLTLTLPYILDRFLF